MTATINGGVATVNVSTDGSTATLLYQFAATGVATVNSITIQSQPTGLTYTDGSRLNLSGLVVTLAYNDGTTKDVSIADFGANGLTTDPANGSILRSAQNGVAVAVIYNNNPAIQAATSPLMIGARAGGANLAIPTLNPAALMLLALSIMAVASGIGRRRR
jgi:hypothetical protein